jgi:tRNA pseudouridine55 synthase
MNYDRIQFSNSVILLDKPSGKTSFDTINELKKIINFRKIGHSGTLDKFASGLLVVCTGWATKLTAYFLNSEKRYIGTIKLGITTDTGDPEGKIIKQRETDSLTAESFYGIQDLFSGEIEQMPPSYSALKIGGRRASDLVREGKEISLSKRKIYIRKLDILKIDLDNSKITIDVTCSKGTYIRSLAMDIGEFLGTGAYLEGLRRISSGNFTIENAATLEEINETDNVVNSKDFLLKPEQALKDFSFIIINNNIRKSILNGGLFQRDDIIHINDKGRNPFNILDEEENLIAIANVDIDNWSIKYLNVFNRDKD